LSSKKSALSWAIALDLDFAPNLDSGFAVGFA